MSSAVRNLLGGALVAGAAAGLLVLVVAGGDYGWRVALAALGLILWVLGGLRKR